MKIGLIAVSGLRLCKTQLMELGFSFPRIAARAKEIEALPSLGLLTIAGMTPENVDVEYLEIRDVADCELPLHFDAIALSALTATSKEAYQLAARFREIGIPVVLGGLHATLQPDEALRHVDAIVVGEGELVWKEVVRDLERGTLQRIYDARTGGAFDLSLAPMPRFDLLSPDRYPRFSVQTQRGCPFSCEFCASSIRLNPNFRVKPPEKVVAEIRRLKALFGKPFIEFADDNTFVNRVHSRDLLRALSGEEVRWFTESDVGIAEHEELLQLMRDAGCAQVLLGFESPDYGALDGIETRSNWKAHHVDHYLEAVEKIQRHGITVNGCFVLGLDGAGTESFDNIFRFVRESGLYDVQITVLTPFPGTPLFVRLSEEGRLLSESATELCTLFDVNFEPDQMSVDELQSGFLDLATRLYNEDFVSERMQGFKRHLRRRVREKRIERGSIPVEHG